MRLIAIVVVARFAAPLANLDSTGSVYEGVRDRLGCEVGEAVQTVEAAYEGRGTAAFVEVPWAAAMGEIAVRSRVQVAYPVSVARRRP